jgi:hypothetical protein
LRNRFPTKKYIRPRSHQLQAPIFGPGSCTPPFALYASKYLVGSNGQLLRLSITTFTMDTITGSKPPQPPAATAGAETVAIQAQVLESGNTQKDLGTEAIVQDEDSTTPPKKAAENGLKNYFVGAPYIYTSPANSILIAIIFVRDQARFLSHHTMLLHLHRIWHSRAIDANSVRCEYNRQRKVSDC